MEKLVIGHQTKPAVCFCTVLKLRIVYIFKEEEYVTETVCGPQSLKYLLSGPLRKKIANPCCRAVFLNGVVLLPRRHLAISEDIFGCYNWGMCY